MHNRKKRLPQQCPISNDMFCSTALIGNVKK